MIAYWDEMKHYAMVHEVPILRDAEVSLFCSLIGNRNPKNVLEIGTAIGYSTLRMASCLPSDGRITTIELDHERFVRAAEFIGRSPYADRICQLEGDGTRVLDDLEGSWDFVFLDGPKGQYIHQLQKLMPKLAPNAWVVADNIRYHDMLYIDGTLPHKHRTAVTRLREFLQVITNRTLFDSVFFENGDGMTVSKWKGYVYAKNGIAGTGR